MSQDIWVRKWNSTSNVSKHCRATAEGEADGFENENVTKSSSTRRVRINLIEPCGKVTVGRADLETDSENRSPVAHNATTASSPS